VPQIGLQRADADPRDETLLEDGGAPGTQNNGAS